MSQPIDVKGEHVDEVPMTPEDRLQFLEKSQQITNARLETMQKAIEEMPDVMAAALEEFGKRLSKSMPQGQNQQGGFIGELFGFAKQFVGPQASSGTDEINSLSRELILMNMRWQMRDMSKRLGVAPHVAITHQ